jgi:hypothetical protein
MHTVTVEHQWIDAVDNFGEAYHTAASRHRWRCPCGKGCHWKHSLANVRWGARRHEHLASRRHNAQIGTTMGAHLIDGEFQSDKYPTCPRGKVPLSVKDPTAQDLLWEYAQRRRSVDAEFSEDLETALRAAGYEPGAEARLHNLGREFSTVGKRTP